MKKLFQIIIPFLLAALILASLFWYCFIYDRNFTRDMLRGLAAKAAKTALENADAEIRFSTPDDYTADRGILHINTK